MWNRKYRKHLLEQTIVTPYETTVSIYLVTESKWVVAEEWADAARKEVERAEDEELMRIAAYKP